MFRAKRLNHDAGKRIFLNRFVKWKLFSSVVFKTQMFWRDFEHLCTIPRFKINKNLYCFLLMWKFVEQLMFLVSEAIDNFNLLAL